MVQVTGLDHVVLNVADAERSLAWYVEHLGATGERVEEWRRKQVPFPSVRLDATTIIDLFEVERSGENLDHLCVVVEPLDLDEVAASGAFEVVRGPVEVWGAQGMGRALYVRDPDGNVVELRHYPTGQGSAGQPL